MSDCGCDNTSSGEDNYLMVKSNKGYANNCGDPSTATSPAAICPVKDPTYDTINSSFVLPEFNGNIDVNVCNVGAYLIGQYIEFVSYGVVMLIVATSETNKTLSLKNACSNGSEIDSNPEAGLGITKGSAFNVVGSPPCGDSASSEAVLAALADAEEICIPALIEGSENASFQLIGRIESDPSNLDQDKCIKRIPGVTFSQAENDKGLAVSGTSNIAEDQEFNFNFLGAHKSNGKFRAFLSPAFVEDAVTNRQYTYGMSKTGTDAVGPVWYESMFNPFHLFEEKNTATNHATYTALASGGEMSKDYSIGISSISSVLKGPIDHYFLELHITVGMSANTGSGRRYLEVLLNDINVGYISGGSSGVAEINSWRFPVRLLKTDTQFNFKLKATGGGISYYYKVLGLSIKI